MTDTKACSMAMLCARTLISAMGSTRTPHPKQASRTPAFEVPHNRLFEDLNALMSAAGGGTRWQDTSRPPPRGTDPDELRCSAGGSEWLVASSQLLLLSLHGL